MESGSVSPYIKSVWQPWIKVYQSSGNVCQETGTMFVKSIEIVYKNIIKPTYQLATGQFQIAGELFAAYKNHEINCIDGDAYVTFVQVALRRIWPWGPNHWAVILRLSNEGHVSIQFQTNGVITAHYHSSEQSAAQNTCGNGNEIRLATFGEPNRKVYWRDVEARLKERMGTYYIALLKDCQNFSRELVRWLTNQQVGIFPQEDGPTYQI